MFFFFFLGSASAHLVQRREAQYSGGGFGGGGGGGVAPQSSGNGNIVCDDWFKSCSAPLGGTCIDPPGGSRADGTCDEWVEHEYCCGQSSPAVACMIPSCGGLLQNFESGGGTVEADWSGSLPSFSVKMGWTWGNWCGPAWAAGAQQREDAALGGCCPRFMECYRNCQNPCTHDSCFNSCRNGHQMYGSNKGSFSSDLGNYYSTAQPWCCKCYCPPEDASSPASVPGGGGGGGSGGGSGGSGPGCIAGGSPSNLKQHPNTCLDCACKYHDITCAHPAGCSCEGDQHLLDTARACFKASECLPMCSGCPGEVTCPCGGYCFGPLWASQNGVIHTTPGSACTAPTCVQEECQACWELNIAITVAQASGCDRRAPHAQCGTQGGCWRYVRYCRNSNGFGDDVVEFVDNVGEVGGEIIDYAIDTGADIVEGVVDVAVDVADYAVDVVGDGLDAAGDAIEGAWNDFETAVEDFFG